MSIGERIKIEEEPEVTVRVSKKVKPSSAAVSIFKSKPFQKPTIQELEIK